MSAGSKVSSFLFVFICALISTFSTTCKSRQLSKNESAVFPNNDGDYIFYFTDKKYMYRLNCKDRNVLPSTELFYKCKEMNKLPFDEFQALYLKTWLDDGVDEKKAANLSSHYSYGLGSNEAFQSDQFESVPDMSKRLERVFSPTPPSEGGGTVVLGQIPKRPAIDPMVKQVVVWNLKDYPGTNMPLSTDEVLQAMNDLKLEFWGHPVTEKIRQDCLNNLVPEWSDLMFHYYCQMGEARKCFTSQAKDHGRTLGGYTTSYEICKYDDKYNFKWIDRNQADIFRYIMYTVGDPEAFNQADQDDVINQFYGVTSPSNCKQRPRRNAPPNPEFPCGQKMGRISLKEQERWSQENSKFSKTPKINSNVSTNSQNERLKSTSQSHSSVDISADSRSDSTLHNSNLEDSQLGPSEGLNSLGAQWYLTPSGTGNCVDLCSTKGGFIEKLDDKVTQPQICESLVALFLGSSSEPAPYRGGSGACEGGCLLNSTRKLFFSCRSSKPSVNHITLGWSRICPCAE
jgi:hypothetical protein